MLRKRQPLEKPKFDMTPMIDVVFLLLIFFVLTFKIVAPEGDFNVQMAPEGQALPIEISTDSVQIRLLADAEGLLSAIQLNSENVDNFDMLRQQISAICLTMPDLEVVLCPDEYLQYDYTMKAITAINTICGNIKFAREPATASPVGDTVPGSSDSVDTNTNNPL